MSYKSTCNCDYLVHRDDLIRFNLALSSIYFWISFHCASPVIDISSSFLFFFTTFSTIYCIIRAICTMIIYWKLSCFDISDCFSFFKIDLNSLDVLKIIKEFYQDCGYYSSRDFFNRGKIFLKNGSNGCHVGLMIIRGKMYCIKCTTIQLAFSTVRSSLLYR